MGLLDRLFGRKNELAFDPGEWTVFGRDSGYGPLVIMVTETYMRVGPDASRPAHVLLRLYLKEPNENGMPFGRELKTVESITDRVDAAAGNCYAVLVARATGNSRREFHIYSPGAPPLLEALRKELVRFRDYQYDLADDHDPDWNAYKALCPTPREQRETSDRSVVMQLTEHGDRAELPRKVDHFVNFPSQEARAGFQQAVVSQGFAVEEASEDREENGSQRWKLHITRVDAVEIDHIVPITEWLEATARHYGGDYDGWGCPVTSQ
jgi:regulator of RNase E activity RraB